MSKWEEFSIKSQCGKKIFRAQSLYHTPILKYLPIPLFQSKRKLSRKGLIWSQKFVGGGGGGGGGGGRRRYSWTNGLVAEGNMPPST